MSNVLGTVNPVADIAAAAREVGAAVLLDGCQAVVHGTVDVQATGADFYVFSGHKLYGPTGIGVLWGKAERLEAMPPYQGGGEMIESVTLDRVTYGPPPGRFEAGTPQVIEAAGLKAAIDWLQAQDRDAIAAHERALYDHTLQRLNGANDIRVLGTTEGKGAILSFELQGAHAHDVAQIMDRYGVAVRAGTHCAEPLMKRFGVTSTARASFALYNTREDADAFVDALAKVRTFFA
jgi:cysteine desulfurase/selenocysteine lyase